MGTILDHLREQLKRVEKSKRYGPDSSVAKFLRDQIERDEGMIRRGRYGPNPDGPRRVRGASGSV